MEVHSIANENTPRTRRRYSGGKFPLHFLPKFCFLNMSACTVLICSHNSGNSGPRVKTQQQASPRNNRRRTLRRPELYSSFLFNTICSRNWRHDTPHQSQTKTMCTLSALINHFETMATPYTHFIPEDSSKGSIKFKAGELEPQWHLLDKKLLNPPTSGCFLSRKGHKQRSSLGQTTLQKLQFFIGSSSDW